MKHRKWDESLVAVIDPVLSGLGFQILQLDQNGNSQQLRITLVVYSKKGVSLEDCVELHKTLLPRIKLEKNHLDIYLDILSPGVGRNLKTVEEFQVFKQEKVKVLWSQQNEWLEGVVESCEAQELLLKIKEKTESDEKIIKIPYDEIQKAKLI